MRNFTPEDFNGGGQYLLRMSPEEIICREQGNAFHGYSRTSYLSTLICKVGYCHGHGLANRPEETNVMTLVDMSDGFTKLGYFDSRNDPNFGSKTGESNVDTWIWVQFDSKEVLCDYLNNPDLCQQERRFATQEEIVRTVMHQRSRLG